MDRESVRRMDRSIDMLRNGQAFEHALKSRASMPAALSGQTGTRGGLPLYPCHGVAACSAVPQSSRL